jgi:hypothetical protein
VHARELCGLREQFVIDRDCRPHGASPNASLMHSMLPHHDTCRCG